jgi:hypothetical protein
MGRTFGALAPLLILALVGCALAVPLLPAEFSGSVTIDGKQAPVGTVITAKIGDRTCGSITLAEAGTYGGNDLFDDRLVVSGEENDASKTITFFVGGVKAQETAVYTPGAFSRLDLTAKIGSPSGPSGPSGGGPGGRSGPGPVAPPAQPPAPVMEYSGNGPLDLDTDGTVRYQTVISTSENGASISIGAGVRAQNRFGRPVDAVTVRSVPSDDLPESGDGKAPFGRALKCGPDGATFDPAIEVSITLTPEEWERLADGERFVVRWYNGGTGAWETIETTAHPSTRTVTAKVSHFTLFAVFAEVVPKTVAPVREGEAVIDGETLPPLPGVTAPVPEAGLSSLWLVVIGAFAVVAAVGAYCVSVKRQE